MPALALLCLLGALHCRWGYTDSLLLGSPTQPTSHLPDPGQRPSGSAGSPGATCGDASGDAGTEPDCGVPVCLTCVDTPSCEADAECSSPTCSDAIQNGSETGIDCGGPCAACLPRPECSVGSECASGSCVQGSCMPPSCSDGVQNAAETGTDCGGPCGATCLDGGGCVSAGDCSSRVCTGNVCQAPTCSDGAHNQDETDVDCGGGCGPCIDTRNCSAPGDCASQVCTGNVCQAPTCSDGAHNQDETDVDCGGGCGPCIDTRNCGAPGDCASQVCTGNVCQAPTCSDTVRNGDEADVDCGGTTCAPCPCTFGTPQVLGNPNLSGAEVWAPTLSNDGLTMYLSATPSGSFEQIAITTRPDRGNTFGAPSLIPSPVNSFVEGTPELSQDGLSLYFFSERFGGTGDRDLYVGTRSSTSVQFNAVSNLASINSAAREDRPWVSTDELSVYFSSQRASSGDDLWRATRNLRSDPFGTPVAVTELNSIGNDAGIYLTPDAKVAFFASDRSGGAGGVDLFRATRAGTSGAFSSPEGIAELNSSSDDIDPQLTADGQELFFASNRSTGFYRIWRSLVTCP